MVNAQIEDWSALRLKLHHFVRSKVDSDQAADDVVQEAIVKVLSNMQKLRDETKLIPWIYAIVRNEINNHFHIKGRIPEYKGPPENGESFCNQELKPCITRFIDMLPEIYKEALQLVEIEGISQKELAQRLNISHSGAKSRVQRGREKLKSQIEECCIIEHDRYGNIMSYRARNCCTSSD